MSARMILSATALLASSLPASGQGLDWDEYRKLGEAAVLAMLVDPDSAQISWSSGYHKGGYKPFLAKRVHGWVACGTVNARNRMGGYAGRQDFIVVIDKRRVQWAGIAKSPTDMISNSCSEALAKGLLPPVPDTQTNATAISAPPSVQPSPALAMTASGLAIRAMPEGGYVSSVAAGSPAASAGLKPGMVIERVNGIPLAGMGDAMVKVIDAAGGDATLAILGAATVKLSPRR